MLQNAGYALVYSCRLFSCTCFFELNVVYRLHLENGIRLRYPEFIKQEINNTVVIYIEKDSIGSNELYNIFKILKHKLLDSSL